jgi:glycosyltransferase involved in cell wall biosynthesis
MNLLISAYACAPNRGSEYGCAWNWIIEVARLGHSASVLVAPNHRAAIEATAHDGALKRIHWVFPEVRHWPLQQGREPRWERTYNLLWQRAALRVARALHRTSNFDIVHHLTWGGIRSPTFLGALGVPLVLGPLGGGETSPRLLRDAFPVRGKILEGIRTVSNTTIMMNPLVRRGMRDAAVIVARTTDTRNLLGPALRRKTLVHMGLSVSREQIGAPRTARRGPPRLLYAGRLLYWKGVHIAIQAIGELVKRMPDVRLTIVGSGPEERRLRADVSVRKLDAHVDFVSWMPQRELLRLHDEHDLLLFPSLHDSLGWVVMESLCNGMPVVCLDLGGPKEVVTAESGVIVATSGLNTRQLSARMADQIYDVLSSPQRLAELSAGAIARAHAFLSADYVTSIYRQAKEVADAQPDRVQMA